MTKVIDMLTQEDIHGAFQKVLEQYNKCIAAGGDYFEGDWSFMYVLSIKVLIQKKSGNLFNDPRNSLMIEILSIVSHVVLILISLEIAAPRHIVYYTQSQTEELLKHLKSLNFFLSAVSILGAYKFQGFNYVCIYGCTDLTLSWLT